MLSEKIYKEFMDNFSDKKHIVKLIKRYFEEGSENFNDILEEYSGAKLDENKKD